MRTSTSPIRYERRLQDGTVEVFAQSGGSYGLYRRVFLTEIIDPRGQTLTLTYDEYLRLASVTDAIGQVTTLAYELPSDSLKVTSITDPFGRSASFTYNEAGQLASVTDVIGLTSSFSYATGDFVASLTTPYGTTAFRHEPATASSTSYRMIEATDPLGGTERLEFYWIHNGLSTTAPSGEVPTGFSSFNTNLHKYNSFYWDKRAWSLHPADIAKATLSHWLLSPYTDPFDGHGFSTSVPHSVKRPLEHRVWYEYPGQGTGVNAVGDYAKPSKTARVLDDSSSQIWQATYTNSGLITSQTDPLGRETSYTYDTNDIDLLEVRQTTGTLDDLLMSYADYTGTQPESTTDAAGETTTMTYNAAGQVLTVTNALSETTTYAYDTDGYLESVTGPMTGATTTYAYDDYGRVESVIDSDDYEVVTTFDALDRPVTIAYPDTTTEVIGYDRLDAVSRRDREGKITRTFYDALQRIISVRDPLGRTITQQWCGCGSLDKLIDARGQSTTWERDLQGRVTREVRADGTTDTDYVYETTTSRLKTVTDPKGQVTTYTYAGDGRTLQMAYTNETIATPDVTFTYDANYPRMATMVDGTGTTSYSYKAPGTAGTGKVASVDGPLTNDTLAITYDELGRMASRLINGYGIASLAYDALGRLTDEENELGTFTYDYDGVTSRLAAVTYPNGQTSNYSYFGNSGDRRLQTIHHQTSAPATLSKFDYTYSADGNIVTWRQQAGTDAAMWEYGYDAAEQLTRAVKKNTDTTPAILKRYAYGYDPAGNRTVEQIDDAVMGASHNSLNRLTSQQPNGVIMVAGTVNEAATVTIQGKPITVSSGNVFEGSAAIPSGTSTFVVSATDTNSNVTTKTYEMENTGSTKTFIYDANGNLTSDGTRTFEWDAKNQLVAVEIGTQRSDFTYDGSQRRVRLIEKDNGVTQSDTKMVWCGRALCEERDSSGTVIRRLFGGGQDLGGTASFYSMDHLGNIREVTSLSGSVTAEYTYEPWGGRTLTAGSEATDIGYTGHQQHGSGAMWLSHYRVYDATTARWISEDPIGLLAGTNRYSYVDGNPTSMTDALGLSGAMVQGGVGVSAMAGILGGSISYGGALTTSGQICQLITICLRLGLGAFAGAGGQFGGGGYLGGAGSALGGGGIGAGIDAGCGLAAGLQAAFGTASASGLRGMGGLGCGLSVGFDFCYTDAKCTGCK